jgi:hypothetical protein
MNRSYYIEELGKRMISLSDGVLSTGRIVAVSSKSLVKTINLNKGPRKIKEEKALGSSKTATVNN